jgi:hypothetical protein
VAKKEPVNVNWQTLFAFIPWFNFFAAYRVEKFRFFALIWIGGYIVFRGFYYFLELDLTAWWVSSEILLLPVTVYLTRRWSKKWNKQLSNDIFDNQHTDDISRRKPLG